MIKLFVYNQLPQRQDYCRLLIYVFSQNEYEGKLFQITENKPYKEMIEIVEKVEDAHYVILPHDYLFVLKETEYLKEANVFAKEHGKKIIVSAYGDSSIKVPMSEAIVLRPSSYRSELDTNEIIVPPFVEDLGALYGVEIREKTSSLPVVGFVGMASLPSPWLEIKYQIKVAINRYLIACGLKNPAKIQGLYFRRQIIDILKKSKTCTTNFIIRSTFSADATSVSEDPVKLRQEYVEVLKSSDLGLVVRGDGNFSLRLFEVLSLGVIPLFIDTDTPLPNESEIPYSEFMLIVKQSDVNKLPQIIEAWWNELTPETFITMQEECRAVFTDRLRADVFYKVLFERLAITAQQK